MLAKKGLIRLVLSIFIILVIIVFVIQNPSLTKEVGKGLTKATAWLVKGGVSIYKESNLSKQVNLSEPKKILEKVK